MTALKGKSQKTQGKYSCKRRWAVNQQHPPGGFVGWFPNEKSGTGLSSPAHCQRETAGWNNHLEKTFAWTRWIINKLIDIYYCSYSVCLTPHFKMDFGPPLLCLVMSRCEMRRRFPWGWYLNHGVTGSVLSCWLHSLSQPWGPTSMSPIASLYFRGNCWAFCKWARGFVKLPGCCLAVVRGLRPVPKSTFPSGSLCWSCLLWPWSCSRVGSHICASKPS